MTDRERDSTTTRVARAASRIAHRAPSHGAAAALGGVGVMALGASPALTAQITAALTALGPSGVLLAVLLLVVLPAQWARDDAREARAAKREEDREGSCREERQGDKVDFLHALEMNTAKLDNVARALGQVPCIQPPRGADGRRG